MSLKPLRQQEQVNTDFVCLDTQERGGCLTLATASGMTYVQYAHDPSDAIPVGIQLNDIEWMNLALQPHRTFLGYNTDVPCGTVGIGTKGDYVTDWLYIVGTVMPGDSAYVGPSGTFTNSSAFGSVIGEFRSTLTAEPHVLVFRGLGFSRQYMDPCTKQLVYENNPADRVLVNSPGYAKIRIRL